MKAKYIQIGKTSILKSSLVGITLEKAIKNHSTIREHIVTEAWREANPEKKEEKTAKTDQANEPKEGK